MACAPVDYCDVPVYPIPGNWVIEMKTSIFTCIGSMALKFAAATNGATVSGSWNCAETNAGCYYRQLNYSSDPCVSYVGNVVGTLSATMAIDIKMSTDSTHAIEMIGTVSGNLIVGSANFADGVVDAFTANAP
jgi:hypothetical protein